MQARLRALESQRDGFVLHADAGLEGLVRLKALSKAERAGGV